MSKPHKHAALIKAWADGAEIEVKALQSEIWHDVPSPVWDETREYRIKQAKVVRWQWIQPPGDGYNPSMTTSFFSEDEAQRTFVNADKLIKAEWTRMEFDE